MSSKHEEDVPEGTPTIEISEEDKVGFVKKIFSSSGEDLFKMQVPIWIHSGESALERGQPMQYPSHFLEITEAATPEERMLRVLRFIFSMHAFLLRPGKKPFNPVTNEHFLPRWTVGDDEIEGVLEQVSHYPPGYAFHFSCESRKIRLYGHNMMKAKLSGMAFRTEFTGTTTIELTELGEKYTFSRPMLFMRGLLIGRPFFDVTDTTKVVCEKTGVEGTITFKEKPWLRGEYGRVQGAVRDAAGKVVFSIEGNWRKQVYYSVAGKDKKKDEEQTLLYENSDKHHVPPTVAPIEEQASLESRRLWKVVADGLESKNNKSAEQGKTQIEERQRAYYKQVTAGTATVEALLFEHNTETGVYTLRPDYRERSRMPSWFDKTK